MARRVFTPQEANRTLPLVRKIVEDILDVGRELRALWEQEREGELDLDSGERRRAEEVVRELEGFFRELDQIGCSFRSPDFSLGLVDFPAVIEDQLVHLCWRSDEEELLYYHDPRAGFAGRKRIPAELLATE
ncbi:MAG: DUF2203 domain-containing protein [Planctomycetota bacterium]